MAYPVVTTVIANDVVQMVARCFCNGQLGLNEYWYQVEAGSTDEDVFSAMNGWWNQASGLYAPLLSNQASIVNCTMKLYESDLTVKSPTYFLTPTEVQGTVSGNPLPTQTCGVITRRIDVVGRGNRGRVYVPFPAASFLTTAERPSAAYQTLLQGLATGLLPISAPYSTIGGNNWDPGIARFRYLQFRPIYAADVQGKWGTQRRRGDYGIPNVYPG